MNSAWFITESSSLNLWLTSPFHFLGLTADKLGSYRPAFYMVGGAFAAAALSPSILYCLKNERMKKKELVLSSSKENAQDAQEFEERSCNDEISVDGTSKTTHDHGSKPAVSGHELFVSTV